jgi:hypothetical protein
MEKTSELDRDMLPKHGYVRLVGRVGHLLVGLVSLANDGGIAVGSLLLLLDKIAATAAAGGGNVDQAAALEVVLLSDVGTLKGHGDPVKSEAAGSPEHQARSVDRLIALEGTVLSETVVGLAEGNARNAASDQAGVDRAEALEEAGVPRLGLGRRLLVDVLAGAGQDIVESVLPVLEVVVVDGTVVVLLGSSGGSGSRGRGGHCE